MTFVCEGVRYDDADLVAFRTGAPDTPLVYLTRDHADVFVVEVDHWTGVTVRRAGAGEVAELAGRFGIDELRRALR